MPRIRKRVAASNSAEHRAVSPRVVKQAPAFHTLVACACVLAAAAAGSAQTATKPVTTAFLPSIDSVAIPNLKGTGTAMDGMCNGFDEMQLAYFRLRIARPKVVDNTGKVLPAPTLRQITTGIIAMHGDKYLQDLMDIATHHSFARGFPTFDVAHAVKYPTSFAGEVVGKMRASGNPQPMVFAVGRDFHRISAYGASKVSTPNGDRWVFRVADSNRNGKTDADDVTLSYEDGNPGHWVEKVAGQEVRRFTGGDLVRRTGTDTPAAQDKYIKMVRLGVQGVGIAQIRSDLSVPDFPLPSVSQGVAPNSVVVVKDPKAGGVLIQFDPALFSGGATSEELSRLDARVKDAMAAEDPGGVLLRASAGTERLVLVPLQSLLEGGATTLGAITRVRGYVLRAKSDISIVGLAEQDAPPIPLDYLTVALRAVYREGMAPYISLDPDPDRLSGPQKIRVGQVPSELRNTAFVRDLVEADYAMKRIMLGKESPSVAGFKRYVDILRETPPAPGASSIRMWFTPMGFHRAQGDVMTFRRDGQMVVLFGNQVQVLTEREKLAGDMVSEPGPVDHAVEAAAGMMTRYFPQLELQVPEFRRLRAAFDVAKLCAAWRAFGVHADALDKLCDRTPETVPLKEAYDGIGPEKLEGTNWVVTGGVRTSPYVSARTKVEVAQLATLLDATGNVDLTLPDTVALPADALADAEDDAYYAQALRAFQECDYSGTVASLEPLLKNEPDDTDALTLRAIALDALHRSKEAIADIGRAAKSTPWLIAMRGLIEARAGDRDAASKDADEAARTFPDEENVRFTNVTTRIAVLDLDGAQKELAALKTLCPASPAVRVLAEQVATLRRLGQEGAARRLRLIRELPMQVAVALGFLGTGEDPGPGGSIGRIQDVLQSLGDPALKLPADLYVGDRCRVGLASLYAVRAARDESQAAGSLKRAEELIGQTIAAHPEWPTPYAVKAFVATVGRQPAAEVARILRDATKRLRNEDPLIDDMRASLNTDHVVQFLGFEMWRSIRERDEDGDAVLEAVIPAIESPGEAAFLRALLDEKTFNLPLQFVRLGLASSGKPADGVLEAVDKVAAKIPDTLAGTDPSYLFAVQMSALALSLRDGTHVAAGFQNAAERALTLAQATDMPPAALLQVAQCRSTSWFLITNKVLEDAIASSGTDSGSMQDTFRALNGFANSGGSDIEAMRKTLIDAKAKLDEAGASFRAGLDSKLEEIRAKHGKLAADVLRLGVTFLQRPVCTEVARMANLIGSRYTELADSPELAALKDYGVTTGWVVPETPAEAWARVVPSVASRVDGEALALYVPAMEAYLVDPPGQAGANDDLRSAADKMVLEMRVKSAAMF